MIDIGACIPTCPHFPKQCICKFLLYSCIYRVLGGNKNNGPCSIPNVRTPAISYGNYSWGSEARRAHGLCAGMADTPLGPCVEWWG